MTDPAERVAALWGSAELTHQLARLQWMASPVVQLHLNERSTGSAARDWFTAWAARFLPTGPLRILVVGCGEGWLERALAGRDSVVHIDAVDVAAAAVARARELAAREGLQNIDYRVADLNVDTIPGDAYNVIIAHSVLHHVARLEHAFTQIENALSADGTLIVNEYVGPRRFQFSDAVLDIINDLLHAIPERFRRGTIEPGVYQEKRRPTEEEMMANDPSEAVRSDELLLMIASRFAVVDRIDLGGTILQHLLYDIAPNFSLADPLARSIVELLCIADGALVDSGAIPSDYSLVAARKQGGPPLRPRRLTLPPLHPEGRMTMRDPLGFGPKRTVAPHVPGGRGPRSLSPWMLRALRVSLLAEDKNRTILNPDSALHRAIERLRFALRRDRSESALDHLLARVPADSEIVPVLEEVVRIAVRVGVPMGV